MEYKGVHTLIEAMSVLKHRGIPLKCAIVGDGDQRQRLEKMARDLGVENEVRFYGMIEDSRRVFTLMKASKAFVYPAAPLGGWALTPLEANAAGIPTITTGSGPVLGINEVVKDGVNGYLLREQSPQLMADKIGMVASDAALRAALHTSSMAYARTFDWDNQALAIEQVYEKVVRQASAGRLPKNRREATPSK